MKIELEDWVFISDYAKMKGVSANWVHKLLKRGKLKFIEHYGRKLIYIGKQDMDIVIYYAVKRYRGGDRIEYYTMPYSLRGSLYMWRTWLRYWNRWSFSEKRTDRICYKLNKNNK